MSFGESAENYHHARYTYPPEVFNYIGEQINNKDRNSIIDLGCGTGISTIELESLGFSKIIGCDIDQDMINIAKLYKRQNIEYFVTSISSMEFKDNTYDIATAFGAFHWFCDSASINEIKRILKPKATFFVVNKNDLSDFRNTIIEVVGQYSELHQAFQKNNYFPDKILDESGFERVNKVTFKSVEKYDLEKIIAFAQSMQLWNRINLSNKPRIIEALRNHFLKTIHGSYYERLISIEVINGINSK